MNAKPTPSPLPIWTALFAVLFAAGCHALKTSSVEPPVTTAPKGVPYFLPTGYLEFSFDVKNTADGKFERLELTTDTKIVPDPKNTFLLNTAGGPLTRTNQKYTFRDGMLSSVHTEDDGEADEILKAIALTWTNVLQINALQGTLGAMDAGPALVAGTNDYGLFRAGDDKAASEDLGESIRRAYPELHGLPHIIDELEGITAFYKKEQGKYRQRLLSTREEQQELLSDGARSAERIVWVDRDPIKPDYGRYFQFWAEVDTEKSPKAGSVAAPGKNTKPGIFVKVPEPLIFDTALIVKPRELYLYRLAKYDEELGNLKKKLATSKEDEAKLTGELEEANAMINNANAKITLLENDLAKLPSGVDPAPITASISAQRALLVQYSTKEDKVKADLRTIASMKKRFEQVKWEAQMNLVLLALLNQLDPDQQRPIDGKVDYVFQRKSFALVPSSYAVNVPLSNSPIGKTTQDVQLTDGVLVSYSVDRPSAVHEVVRVPLDITGAVIAQVSQLVQLKIDLAGKEKAYAQALVDLQKVHADLESLATKQERDAKLAELEFEKKITELKAANLTIAGQIQSALLSQGNAAELAAQDHQKTLQELRANISDSVRKIAENDKKISDLEKEVTDLKE